jgi:hypothetical protein
MAGMRRGARPTPAAFFSLRLASALATIFFVLVFAGDLIGRAVQPEPRQVLMSSEQQQAPFGMGGVEVQACSSHRRWREARSKIIATPTETLELEAAITNLAPGRPPRPI